jgi:osmoprotectant transport system permease protein
MAYSLLRLVALLLLPALSAAETVVHVGSKRFTESYILAEIVARTVDGAGEARAQHHQGMGNTAILFAALKSGAIHAYPEYTGTVAIELLGQKQVPPLAELDRMLARHGVAAGVPLGFANSYALAMVEAQAEKLGIRRISDLARHPGLRLALSQEFLNRRDGWPALQKAYGLSFGSVRGLDHGLAYEALIGGRVDVVDAYATDAKIARHGLRMLEDDRRFFPAYDAVILYRRELPQQFPRSWAAIERLGGRISAGQMAEMNAAAEVSALPFSAIAERFLAMPEDATRR